MTAAGLETVRLADLVKRARALLASGGRFQMLYAWLPRGEPELRYIFTIPGDAQFGQWRVLPDKGGRAVSLAPSSPLLGWYEREIADLFGIAFEGHPQPAPLVLPTGTPPPFAPERPPLAIAHGDPLPAVDDPDVQRLPWGPVRAGVVESGEFVFDYVGEHIVHYTPLLFFKHRGVEKRFEGMAAAAGVVLAERVSGVGSFAHALAYCQAIEAAAGCAVPERARLLRVLLGELERLYNHLYYLGHLADTTTLKVGHAEGVLLAEFAKQLNGRLTGSRFLRGLLTPGGLRRDVNVGQWFGADLARLSKKARRYVGLLARSNSYLDRLITTGVLDRRIAFDQGATGPVERASGLDRDPRRDHPYAGYDRIAVGVVTEQAGDAHARSLVRTREIRESITAIRHVLDCLDPGPVRAACVAPPGSEGLGWAESPRGTLFYAVHLGDDGRLARVKIKSPSFSNWRAYPFTVHETNMMDYAINEASFGLTIAGCDR
jgi:Ni,Fe-hydrogenase III large subunit